MLSQGGGHTSASPPLSLRKDGEITFKHESKTNDTELSKHLRHLKDEKKDFAISWKNLANAKSYTDLTKVTQVIQRNSVFYVNQTC